MFKSEPICVLTAGPTIDGRDIPQKIIDDIAETYDPKKYAARINDDHSRWSWKGGSVLSAEARGNELWVEVKPNSHLLRNIENGQLLHTSCEYLEDFAGSGKAYLTGLAFTDEPASLGTTQVHLSAKAQEENKQLVSSGQVLNFEELSNTQLNNQTNLSNEPTPNDQSWFIRKLTNLLKSAPDAEEEQLSKQEESEPMSTELEKLIKLSTEANSATNEKLDKLIEKLSATETPDQPETNEPEETTQLSELETKVETLSSQLTDLTDKLSKITDEGERHLSGEDKDQEQYL
ncbi:MAG: GPO family capsid scaffolding protein [Pseudomonadota bacterium]